MSSSSTGISQARTFRQNDDIPYRAASSQARPRVRPSVVTTLKPRPRKLAVCMAASAMPTTGPLASSRAASRPGSPKQAMT